MARKVRIQYPGAVCHVMHRGDRREAIFAGDQGRRRFLETLEEACQAQIDARPGVSHFGGAVQEAEADRAGRLTRAGLAADGLDGARDGAAAQGRPRQGATGLGMAKPDDDDAALDRSAVEHGHAGPLGPGFSSGVGAPAPSRLPAAAPGNMTTSLTAL